jgi:uncharacterized protein
MRAALLSLVVCFALVLGAGKALAAFVVPPIQGHVTDTAGVLDEADRAELERRLTDHMTRSGAEIAVFVVGSLEGQSIEDVAYTTFDTWRVGRASLDNGVLLVLAPRERRIRIETGKGVGGQLTDLQASDIIEHRIAPRLREGRYRDAIADGTDAIAEALGAQPTQEVPTPFPLLYLGIPIALVVIALALLRFGFGMPVFWWLLGAAGRGRGFGGGRPRSGGYSGGGGRSGGGGASGSW